MQHHLPSGRRLALLDGPLVVEVEAELGPRHLPDRGRTPGVQALDGPQRLQGLRSVGDRGGQVEGVGQVQLRGHAHGAGEGDLLLLDRHMTGVGTTGGLQGRPVGVEPGDRGIDEPVEGGGGGAVRERGELPVHERGGLAGQVGVDGGLGDPAGLPRSQLAGLDAAPQPRQPVPQLQGLADEPLRRHRRHPQRRLRRISQSTARTGVAEHRSSGVGKLARHGGHRRTQPGATDISAAPDGPLWTG